MKLEEILILKKKWDKSTWYKVDLVKINSDLKKLGYHLEKFKFKDGTDIDIFNEESEVEESPSDSIFHGESSSFHYERAIPEGFTEGPSENEFEEEDIITLDKVIAFLNQQINKREITNPKTLTAIYEVAAKCKAIGTNDVQAMENFCIKVVEEKMSRFGLKKREAKKPIRSTRKELIPEWFG